MNKKQDKKEVIAAKHFDLNQIVDFVILLVQKRNLTLLDRKAKVKEVLIAVYAAGSGRPVIKVDKVREILHDCEVTRNFIRSDWLFVDDTGVSFKEGVGITREQVMAILHWLDNRDLY